MCSQMLSLPAHTWACGRLPPLVASPTTMAAKEMATRPETSRGQPPPSPAVPSSWVDVACTAGAAGVLCCAALSRRSRHRRQRCSLGLQHRGLARHAAATLLPEECSLDNERERRFNPWDGKVYSLAEMRRWADRADWSEEELFEHWCSRCIPQAVGGEPTSTTGTSMAPGAIDAADGDEAPRTVPVYEVPVPEHVAEWRRIWKIGNFKRMRTKADQWHLHSHSATLFMFIGLAYLFDVAVHDLSGGSWWSQHVPTEAAVLALAFGAVSAASGLQPALLAAGGERPLASLEEALGVGPRGNLKSGGFVNTGVFYFILAYQGLRALVLPAAAAGAVWSPILAPATAVLDPFFGLLGFAATGHTAYILNGWVEKGALHRVDVLMVPPLLNLPVSLHLIMGGQLWMEQMAAQYPAFPEVFFAANFALAWSLSLVTFFLSLHERKVLSVEARSALMLVMPVLVFPSILFRVAHLLPSWFEGHGQVMLTLSPGA